MQILGLPTAARTTTDALALDQEDMARVLAGFLGQPVGKTPPLRFHRAPSDGPGLAWVFDNERGMAWIVE